jgi:hypothetical protein
LSLGTYSFVGSDWLFPFGRCTFSLQENWNISHVWGIDHLKDVRLIGRALPFRFGSIRFVIGRFLAAQRSGRGFVMGVNATGQMLTGAAAIAVLTVLAMLVSQQMLGGDRWMLSS